MVTSSPTAAFILLGNSTNNSLTFYGREVARSLQKLGIKPIEIDLLQQKLAIEAMQKGIETYKPANLLAFSFAGIGMEIGDDMPAGNIWKNFKIPILSWMGDHPAYLIRRHRHPSPAAIRLYPTQDFAAFHRDYIRTTHRTAYCPLGARDYGITPQPRKITPGQTPLIIFPKTIKSTRELDLIWTNLPSMLERILKNAVEIYWGETPRSGPVESSVLKAAGDAGLELSNDLSLFCFCIANVDEYIRRRKAEYLLKSLLSQPVRILGDIHTAIDMANAKATIVPAVDYGKLVELLHQSYAVVTMNPNVEQRGHDRIYSALGCRALPISDTNPWWEKNYPRLAPYSFDFKDKTPAMAVQRVLDEPQTAAQIAWDEGEKEMANCSFDDCVKQAVEMGELTRYFDFHFQTPLANYVKDDVYS